MTEKISIKRAELSVQKFNEVAVPHHVGLLKNHKSNIEKSVALSDWEKIKREEINATRVLKNLKNLLLEMESLRSKIEDEDVPKFDKMTSDSRQIAMEAIKEYMNLQLVSPAKSQSTSYGSFKEAYDESEDLPELETNYQITEHQLRSQEACLAEFENLQHEVEDLHDLFGKFNETVHEQREQVQEIAENVETTQENVVAGEKQLQSALKYKKAMYPLCGAILGSCIGGPIGFVAGLKAGSLAAVGCGLLGFTGGTVLKKTDEQAVDAAAAAPPPSSSPPPPTTETRVE